MPSISFLYSKTLHALHRLIFALSGDDRRAVLLGQVEVSELQDKLGRLQVWGDQSRASLPQSREAYLSMPQALWMICFEKMRHSEP
jgi:hypothetical protein